MNKDEMKIFQERAMILKAVSHPTRLIIADELNKGEKCVSELTEIIGADTSTVSKHLTILKNAGIVADEKRGKYIYYNLSAHCVIKFFDCIEKMIEKSALDKSSLYLNLKKK